MSMLMKDRYGSPSLLFVCFLFCGERINNIHEIDKPSLCPSAINELLEIQIFGSFSVLSHPMENVLFSCQTEHVKEQSQSSI